MRIPDRLAGLVEDGLIEEIVRPLMSGKEAQVYLVVAGGRTCVAKVYKAAQERTFKHRSEYTEGRKTRNTRDQRAMGKRTRHGRAQDEAAWQSTEVDMIRRLRTAGVRVPTPYQFTDGVLFMELITDEEGEPAPRLGEVHLSPEEATLVHQKLLRDVVRMLCAGVIHGDLSDFNVLMAADGPVIIDLPQAIESSRNSNARKLLLRDVDNLHRFLQRSTPLAPRVPYGEEMWELYEKDQLTPETPLTGDYRPSQRRADTGAVLDLIDDAERDERFRRQYRGEGVGAAPPRRRGGGGGEGGGGTSQGGQGAQGGGGRSGDSGRRSDRSASRPAPKPPPPVAPTRKSTWSVGKLDAVPPSVPAPKRTQGDQRSPNAPTGSRDEEARPRRRRRRPPR